MVKVIINIWCYMIKAILNYLDKNNMYQWATINVNINEIKFIQFLKLPKFILNSLNFLNLLNFLL